MRCGSVLGIGMFEVTTSGHPVLSQSVSLIGGSGSK